MTSEIVEHPALIGYGASRDGRIWSRYPGNGKGPLKEEWQRELKPGHSGPTRKYMHFSANGRSYRVHRFVLECFVGPCPEDMVCRHLDGDPSNNALNNLAWGTRQENEADKIRHGTNNRGYGFAAGR